MPQINRDRLIGDLRKLATFGKHGTGVHRPSLSPQDIESRRWLVGRMREAGLDAQIDGLGTVFGRSANDGPVLLIGSHTDTQPRGGWLDGAMGVIYGLEVARALAEDPSTRHLAVDVASWIDEEGAFGSCVGSRWFCGTVDQAYLDSLENSDGQSFNDALAAAGLADRPRAALEEGRYHAYLEAHIEQGGTLEAAGNRIGVVTGIVGLRNFTVRFKGTRNHAGTTPMPMRRDAVTALVEFAHAVNRRFPALVGPRTVWTMGRILVEPNAPSVVPGEASVNLQFRDTDAAVLAALEAEARALVEAADSSGPCSVSIEPSAVPQAPTHMAPPLQEHIARAAERHAPGKWVRMPSGAGHDAMVLVARMPAAMLFVPSIGGISHDIAEDTGEDDLALGCQVMADAAASILQEARKPL